MKHLLLCIAMAMCLVYVSAQTDVKITRPDFTQNVNARFRLFPTQNIWTFIKLDTSDGRLWVVQYSMNSDSRFELPLSNMALCLESEKKNGRFTLYSTSNIHTFILLDQISGDLWQVQWGTKTSDFMVVRIK